MFKKTALMFISFALLFLIITAVILFSVTFAHGAVSSKRPNSLGLEQIYMNPNIYLFASIADGTVIEGDHDDMYTNIRFQPYNTMSIYDETVLFCGNEVESFRGKHGALVVTYRRQASRAFKGIACHDLKSVFEVPTPEGQ